MANLRAQARRFAFGDSTESLSSRSTASGQCSNMSTPSLFSNPGMIRQSSSMSELSCTSLEKDLNIVPRRTHQVRRLPRDRPTEDFITALQTDGCVVVKQFVNPQISQRVHSAQEEDLPIEEENSDDATAVDITSFIRESFESDSLFDAISAHFLSLETMSWQDKQARTSATRHQIYSSTTRRVSDLSASQPFHRADSALHVHHHATIRYEYQHHSRRDALVGLFVPDVHSVKYSPSVRVIPGSQLWNDQKPDLSRGSVSVELQEGDAFVVLGSLYYSVSRPKSQVDDCARPALNDSNVVHELWTCSGIYRPV